MIKPSQRSDGDRYTVRVYLDSASDPQVFTNCKHYWWTNKGRVFVLLQYMDDGSFRYVHRRAKKIDWVQVTLDAPIS